MEHPYRVIGYFPSWLSSSGKDFLPSQIPVQKLTHLIYAFAEMKENGQCDHYDKYADIEKLFPGDDPCAPGNNVYGNVQQICALKKRHRHLKTIISIGGWRLSGPWSAAVSTPERRSKFVETCMHCMYNFGWDGIDLAWVFPQTDTDAQNYVLLVKEFRKAIDQYKIKAETNELTLSATAPPREDDFTRMKVKEMDEFIDFWNVMAYDVNGRDPSANSRTMCSYSAALRPSREHPDATQFSVEEAILRYTDVGKIDPRKLNLGINLYGCAYYNTKGPGNRFGAMESDWQKNLFEVRELPLAGASTQFDTAASATYSYDASRQMMVSFENAKSILSKLDAVQKDWGLGGVVFWDVSADAIGERSLISLTAQTLGGENCGKLDYRQNTIHYPFSDKDNIRNSGHVSFSDRDEVVSKDPRSLGEEQISFKLAPEMLKSLFPFLPDRKVVDAVFTLS